jgi:hypothetical protein
MQEPFDNDDEHNEEYIENLRLENEIKKIKLSLEHGTDISQQLSATNMPPEIEGQFLDYIQQFEDEFAKRKTILVYDLVGRPEHRPVADIPDEEISAELDKLMDILHENSIAVDVICEVEEREVYRFITEELFELETDDIRIPGMTHAFIYEEFHPNHEHDVKNRCTHFVKFVLDKEFEDVHEFLSLADEVQLRETILTKKEVAEKIRRFRDAFSEFTLHDFTILNVDLNEAKNDGEAKCSIHYSATIEGSVESLEYKGDCRFRLRRDDEWWHIYQLDVPGIVL